MRVACRVRAKLVNRRGCLPDVKDQVALQRPKRIEISSIGVDRTLGN